MALLPAGDGAGFAAVSSLDPHISHAWRTLKNLDHAESQILIEGILGNNVHAERHCLGMLILRLLQIIFNYFQIDLPFTKFNIAKYILDRFQSICFIILSVFPYIEKNEREVAEKL